MLFVTSPKPSEDYFVKSGGYFSLQIFYKTNLYLCEKAHLLQITPLPKQRESPSFLSHLSLKEIC